MLDFELFLSKDKKIFISMYVDEKWFFVTDNFRLEDIQQKFLCGQCIIADLDDISH